jgi:aminoglycoside phosphotransferase (APT) family kinase protein
MSGRPSRANPGRPDRANPGRPERAKRVEGRNPPAEALAWVERAVGRGARIAGSRRLTGGVASLVHLLTVERRGVRQSYVLRRWRSVDVERSGYFVDAVRREAAVLSTLVDSDVPAPRVIASSTDAAHGGPALLMSRVPGRVHLMPADRETWLRQMAQMLARIHALDVAARPFESWLDVARLSPPPDAKRPALWRKALSLVADAPARARTCFIHRDYQHFNLLWSREQLTGVVDWVEASVGPPEIDVGHCRLNLTLLFSADIAERFREMYEAEAGRAVDPWWDVHALLSYGPDWKEFLALQIDGRAPLDVDGMTSRMEDVLERTLRRL